MFKFLISLCHSENLYLYFNARKLPRASHSLLSLNYAIGFCQISQWYFGLFSVFQQLQASYSFYTWPSAPVLAWFLWERRQQLPGKHIVELGAGTALPGILAAKCGAVVTLTDSACLPKSLQHIRHCCEVNGLLPNQVRRFYIDYT